MNDKEYQKECERNELEYEGGLVNFFEAIRLDRADILEEHFRRGERELNKNLDFTSYFSIKVELPLIYAIKNKAYGSIVCLLKHKADPDAYCKKTKATPRQYALKHKRAKALELFEKGSEFTNQKDNSLNNFNNKVFNKKTKQKKPTKLKYKRGPLNIYDALVKNNVEVLQRHIDEGWNEFDKSLYYPMPPGFYSELPLIVAIKNQSYDVLKLLLEHKANPDVVCWKVWMSPRQFAKENDETAYQIVCEFENKK